MEAFKYFGKVMDARPEKTKKIEAESKKQKQKQKRRNHCAVSKKKPKE